MGGKSHKLAAEVVMVSIFFLCVAAAAVLIGLRVAFSLVSPRATAAFDRAMSFAGPALLVTLILIAAAAILFLAVNAVGWLN